QVQRVMPRLMQVTAVKPEVLLLGGLPHVAQLAFVRARILGGAGAQAPATPYLVGHFLGNQLGSPAVHRAIAGGIDNQISWQATAVTQHNGILLDTLDTQPR